MSAVKARALHAPGFKAKVGLEAIRGVKMPSQIGQEQSVHPVLVGQWKKTILENAGTLFDGKRGPKVADNSAIEEKLYAKIGRLEMDIAWLKKKLHL